MKIQTAHSHHTHRASGPGGSHVGMFGRSTIFLSAEGDSPSGGTGAPPPSDPPPGTAPAGDPPKVFTQEQVNAIAAKAREEGRQASRVPPPPPAPPPKPSTPAEELAQLRTANEELALRMAFDKRAARLGLDDEASDELFELYRVQKPTDPGAWFEKKSKLFKLTTTTANADPTKTPAEPPISNKGSPAPGDTRDIDYIVAENPIGASRVEIERLVAKHGEAKARRMLVEAGQRKAANIKVTI